MSTGERPTASDTWPASGSTVTYPRRKPLTMGAARARSSIPRPTPVAHVGQREHHDVRVGGPEQHGERRRREPPAPPGRRPLVNGPVSRGQHAAQPIGARMSTCSPYLSSTTV